MQSAEGQSNPFDKEQWHGDDAIPEEQRGPVEEMITHFYISDF